jgi:hypothetical protein
MLLTYEHDGYNVSQMLLTYEHDGYNVSQMLLTYGHDGYVAHKGWINEHSVIMDHGERLHCHSHNHLLCIRIHGP